MTGQGGCLPLYPREIFREYRDRPLGENLTHDARAVFAWQECGRDAYS